MLWACMQQGTCSLPSRCQVWWLPPGAVAGPCGSSERSLDQEHVASMCWGREGERGEGEGGKVERGGGTEGGRREGKGKRTVISAIHKEERQAVWPLSFKEVRDKWPPLSSEWSCKLCPYRSDYLPTCHQSTPTTTNTTPYCLCLSAPGTHSQELTKHSLLRIALLECLAQFWLQKNTHTHTRYTHWWPLGIKCII